MTLFKNTRVYKVPMKLTRNTFSRGFNVPNQFIVINAYKKFCNIIVISNEHCLEWIDTGKKCYKWVHIKTDVSGW